MVFGRRPPSSPPTQIARRPLFGAFRPAAYRGVQERRCPVAGELSRAVIAPRRPHWSKGRTRRRLRGSPRSGRSRRCRPVRTSAGVGNEVKTIGRRLAATLRAGYRPRWRRRSGAFDAAWRVRSCTTRSSPAFLQIRRHAGAHHAQTDKTYFHCYPPDLSFVGDCSPISGKSRLLQVAVPLQDVQGRHHSRSHTSARPPPRRYQPCGGSSLGRAAVPSSAWVVAARK